MNILDRAIAGLAPGWAAAREESRYRLAMFQQARGYSAGETGRLQQGWNPTRTSQNETLAGKSSMMLARSRDLSRNNAWATMALRRLPAAIVGTQVTASVQIEAPRTRKAVSEDWDWLRENGNGAGDASWDADLHRVARTVVEAGDCLLVWNFTPAAQGDRVPLRWRALPPDYIDAARLAPSVPGNVVLSGVEVDPDGRTVGVWLYERHPLDTVWGQTVPSRLYPREQVDLVHEPLWLGQRRGVPWLAPVTMSLDELAQYETAALWKARMAASFALVRKRMGPAAAPLGTTGTDDAGRPTVTLAPGTVLDAGPGDELSALSPPTDDNFRMFWETRLFAIAAGLGLPVHALSGDLSKANYSSLREGKLLFWELVDQWQWHMVHDQVLRAAWRRFGQARFAVGRTMGGVLPPVRWSFPKRPWVDPKKDIEALTAELDLGLTTWPEAIAARGEDAEAQLAEIEAWRNRLAAVGMPVGRATMARAAPAAPPPEAEDEGDGADTIEGTADE